MFNFEKNSLVILILSILSGFPSSARFIDSFTNENLISIDDGNKLIKFCHFANPLFIINFIGFNILEDSKFSFYILISHYLSNFILMFFNKTKHCKEKIFSIKQNTFGNTLSKSFKNTINSLFIILGNLITFKLLINILFHYFNFSSFFKAIIALLLELTSGLYYLKVLNINIVLKSIIITFALSFGGFCIHSQVYSIMGNNLNYKSYLVSRLLQALIASLILILIV